MYNNHSTNNKSRPNGNRLILGQIASAIIEAMAGSGTGEVLLIAGSETDILGVERLTVVGLRLKRTFIGGLELMMPWSETEAMVQQQRMQNLRLTKQRLFLVKYA